MNFIARHPWLTLIIIFLALIAWSISDGATKKSHPSTVVYDKAFNECLDLTLEVGGEWRAQRRSYRWDELQAEVCRRAHVQRKAPWNR